MFINLNYVYKYKNLLFLHYIDCANKKSVNTTKISELQQKIDTVICNINTITLQQEVIDKKISNVIKLQENLQNELEEAKKQTDALAIERINLELGKCIYLESKFVTLTLYGFSFRKSILIFSFLYFQK